MHGMVRCRNRLPWLLTAAILVMTGSALAVVDTRFEYDEVMLPYKWQYYLGDPAGAEKPEFLDADWPTWLSPWKLIHQPTPDAPPGYAGVKGCPAR